MSVHITENSLRRIAGIATTDAGPYRRCACLVQPPGMHYPPSVIVNEVAGYPVDFIADVTCSACRVLIDAALEKLDVIALMHRMAP